MPGSIHIGVAIHCVKNSCFLLIAVKVTTTGNSQSTKVFQTEQGLFFVFHSIALTTGIILLS
jgi:hypothetical protein